MSLIAPQDFGQPLVLEDFIPVEQPVTASSPPLCTVCHKTVTASQRCAGCQNIKYCSKSCQVRIASFTCLLYSGISQSHDWPTHKALCKRYATSTRPTPGMRRALLFATSKPRFIWLSYRNDGAPLDMQTWFPNTPRGDIRTIGFHNRFLPYWIQLSYDSNPEGKRSLAANGGIGGAFRGNVVALAYDAEEGLSKPALDVDTTTLGPVLEYAKLRKEYEGPVFVEQPQKRYTEKEWMEVLGKASNRAI